MPEEELVGKPVAAEFVDEPVAVEPVGEVIVSVALGELEEVEPVGPGDDSSHGSGPTPLR